MGPYTAVADLRPYHPRERFAWVEMTLAHLQTDEDLVIILEHEPRYLHEQLRQRYGDRMGVICLEAGPEVWRYRLQYTDGATEDGDR